MPKIKSAIQYRKKIVFTAQNKIRAFFVREIVPLAANAALEQAITS